MQIKENISGDIIFKNLCTYKKNLSPYIPSVKDNKEI